MTPGDYIEYYGLPFLAGCGILLGAAFTFFLATMLLKEAWYYINNK